MYHTLERARALTISAFPEYDRDRLGQEFRHFSTALIRGRQLFLLQVIIAKINTQKLYKGSGPFDGNGCILTATPGTKPNTLTFAKINPGTSALFETAINREDRSSGAIRARNGERVISIQGQYRKGRRKTREAPTSNIRMTADVRSQYFHGENIQK